MKGNLLKLIRPHQWLKNVFVMIPMFFGGSLLDPSDILASVITFFAFSFIASSVYCFNDIIDVDADRRHPVKCKRPIASGAVSLKSAWALMALMFLLSAVTVCMLDTYEHIVSVGLIILVYYILNILIVQNLSNMPLLMSASLPSGLCCACFLAVLPQIFHSASGWC